MEDILLKKLKSLLPVYEKVKTSMLMLETIDGKQEAYVAPMNEMRNALDHIFTAILYSDNAEKFDDEFLKVKEHLGRAAYDSLDLLAAILGLEVTTKLRPYDLENLASVFPTYYTEIRPEIADLQKYIVECRIARDISCDKYLFAYLDVIKRLHDINKLIDKHIPSLNERREKRDQEKDKHNKELEKQKEEFKKEKKKERIIGFVFAIIIAIITWFLTKYL